MNNAKFIEATYGVADRSIAYCPVCCAEVALFHFVPFGRGPSFSSDGSKMHNKMSKHGHNKNNEKRGTTIEKRGEKTATNGTNSCKH